MPGVKTDYEKPTVPDASKPSDAESWKRFVPSGPSALKARQVMGVQLAAAHGSPSKLSRLPNLLS